MPTGLQDNGFFSDEAASLSAKIKTEYKQLFFYLAEANEQAHKYLARLQVKSQDLKELVTVALFARMLSAYQAMIFLAERGFTSEVRATCRSILEAKFKLGYLAVEPKAAEMMLANHEKERIKRLERYKSGDLGATYTLVCDWAPVDSATRLTNRSPTLHGLRQYRQQAGGLCKRFFSMDIRMPPNRTKAT